MALVEFTSNSAPYINADNLNEIQKSNIYSTDEIEIGKWIDNKPIYRKVIDLGVLPDTTVKAVSSGLIPTNITITKFYGCLGWTNKMRYPGSV